MIQNLGLLESAGGSESESDVTGLTEVTAVAGDKIKIVDATDGAFKKIDASDFLSGVADNSITNAKLSDIATSTIKGRVTAGSGNPEDLTATQVRALLNVADGSTANPNALNNLVEDTTPQLGGNLDANTNDITNLNGITMVGDIDLNSNDLLNVREIQSANDTDITISGLGTGKVIIDGLTYPSADGTSEQVLKTDGAGNLSFTTIASGGLGNVAEDTTPQLGGNLDVNGNKIVSVSNGNIDIEPNGTGNVLLGNFTFDADQTVGVGQDNHVLTYDNATGLISLEASAGGSSTSINLGTATSTNSNAIDDGTTLGQLDLSTTHNHIITLNANTDTSHYDYTSLSDGDIIYITFKNSSGSDKTITFNTGDLAPVSTLTIGDGSIWTCRLMKEATLYKYMFDVPLEAI